MKQFAYKDFDLEGKETLESIAVAEQFNEWLYQTISQRLEGRILEIGSGIGNISQFFLRDKRKIFLSDLRASYCNYLYEQFNSNVYAEGIFQIDLVHPDFDRRYAHLLSSFDGLFALNVIEHIYDDRKAIANARQLLRPGGRMVILVPAFQMLYNEFDKALEHYRRYDKQSLSTLLMQNDLRVDHAQYFNFAGLFGWFVSGTLLKKKIIPTNQMRLYNLLVPIFKVMDQLVRHKIGLSVLVEGVKN